MCCTVDREFRKPVKMTVGLKLYQECGHAVLLNGLKVSLRPCSPVTLP